jgi:hypothetical protein
MRAGCVACLLAVGCATAPPLDNPVSVRFTAGEVENPVLVSPGQPTAASYHEVFETVVDVMNDYFELLPPNPYDGRVIGLPRVAPGYEQFWKAGNPDPRNRLMATFQSMRQSGVARIWAGDRGGYMVEVVVDRELEDLARPVQARIGGAAFAESPTVDRHVEVVGPDVNLDQAWFKVGRDYALEQQILRRIRNCR